MINKATEQRIKELAEAPGYSYRHIQIILAIEKLGDHSISFIYKIAKKYRNGKTNNKPTKTKRGDRKSS